VGTHGLLIHFCDPASGAQRSATYLPEIAAREGWSRRGTVESLLRKAGYNGSVSEALLRQLRVTRYQSSPLTRSYGEYAQAAEERAHAAQRNAAAQARREGGR
jgi:AMMECR1 domain-containing protein